MTEKEDDWVQKDEEETKRRKRENDENSGMTE